MRHLLVTNDFPPKIGGIQSYLWELWRRLPPDETTVLTSAYAGAETFDREQPYRVERMHRRFLLPTSYLRATIDALAAEVGAGLVLLDPVWPLGVIGPALERPYGVVLHGAEVTIPARHPLLAPQVRRTLRGARLVVSAGGYPAREAERCAKRHLPVALVPPGVDVDRFWPLGDDERAKARARWGVGDTERLVVSVSRLVPRKGMDVLIRAVAAAARRDVPGVRLLVAGEGRDRGRLERLIEQTGAPARLVGRVDDPELPALHGCADVFAMLCRNRWAGLEQEGFGIVFLEAAACGVPQVAGRSGGSHEAVVHGETGLVVDDPRSVEQVTAALVELLTDDDRRASLGRAARERAVSDFTYDLLAARLRDAIDATMSRP